MTREPAKRIPESILHGRDLLNELATEGLITFQKTNPNWSENNFNCFPFDAQIKYSKQNSEFEVEITVGRVFDTSAVEILADLPIPVNFAYSLDPIPVFSVKDTLTVGIATTKIEMWNFLQLAVVKTLMATHTLLVTDSFESECKQRISNWDFPSAHSAWDYYGIAEQMLRKR